MKRQVLPLLAATALVLALGTSASFAKKKYGPGVTDKEIKVGNIMPYSGPASAYGQIGKTIAAYFKMVNAEGGINGRKINFISYDDGYSPPKTVEQARKLVERDHVLFIFQSLGTPTNTAIHKYMNAKKVPQLFVATGATKWGDYKHFHWTMGWQPTYQSEGHIYAKYILANHPDGKIGILYQNDDYGKDYVKGLKDGLGAKAAKMIVSEQPYETSEPTVNSQIVNLKASGANIFFNVTTPKFAAQAIKKAAEIGWHPVQLLNNVSQSIGGVLKPAGLQNAKGVLSTYYLKDSTDPAIKNDAGYKQWLAFMDKYFPDGDKTLELHGLRLYRGADARAGAQAVRRQSHARERDEAGGQPEESRSAHAAAGHQDQHQPDRLLSPRADADAAVRRQGMEAGRPDHERRARQELI